ncbi:MAG: ATP synthase F1 subunit delta [Ignavibacterium sp.]|nr:MAG: ATP synthase F1 subunit delta [Ignavibacterium sp.]
MASSKIANRYATSLFENSLEKDNLETVYKDINLFTRTFDESHDLRLAIESPIIRTELKLSFIDEIFADKLSKDTLNFIHFVIDKKREELFYEIGKRFVELRNEHLGIVEMEVTTAFEFTKEQILNLKDKFETILNKKVIIKISVDENIIGGFMAQVGDTVYDASVIHQLDLLRKEFKQGGLALN